MGVKVVSDNNQTQLSAKKSRIEQIIEAVTARGNNVEFHESKDGLKVYEVSKKLVATLKKQ